MAKTKTEAVQQPVTAHDDTWTVGRNYLVLTPTHYYVGRLIRITATELVFHDCAWIPDTGRWHACFESGQFAEVEPWPTELILPRFECKGAGWPHPLPRAVK